MRKMCSYLSLITLAAVLHLSGCTGKEDKTEGSSETSENAAYTDWERFRYGDVTIIHPPDQLQQAGFEEIAKVFSALSRQACRFLRIQPPDSIVIYFYNDVRQGLAVTGQGYPFSDGAAIHFWLPSFPGAAIVKHLLPRWQPVEPKHQFLKHGIISLLDGSEQNYHQFTLALIDSGTFINLRDLAADTNVNSDFERLQSAEAASLVDFVVYTYSIGALKELYRSDGEFEEDVLHIFGLPVDSIEQRWLDFVYRFAVSPAESGGERKN